MTQRRSGKSLTHEQNESVRALLRDLLKSHSQTEIERLAGLDQSTQSRFLSGHQGTSFYAAQKLAELANVDVGVLLGLSASGYAHPLRVGTVREWPRLLDAAKQRKPYISDDVWRRVGSSVLALPESAVTVHVLSELGQLLYDALMADEQRRRDDVTPVPSSSSRPARR